MTYTGYVRGGIVVLDEPTVLPEGTAVEVTIAHQPAGPDAQSPATVYEQLADLEGKAEGLPADLARNHDHYLHGLPKK